MLALVVTGACNNQITGLGPPSDPASETFDPSLGIIIADMTKLESGVYIEDLILGDGDSVFAETDTVWLTYTGFLKTGEEFDSGTNVRFPLGDVVPGRAFGVQGMKIGGRRMIVIPSALGYGDRSVTEPGTVDPVIPRQSTLIFRVELLRVFAPPEEEDS
jgi:peptidylprolyl isomerase